MLNTPSMKQISMSRRLTLALVLAMTLAMMIVAAVFYQWTAEKLEQNFTHKIEQAQSYLKGALAPLLWNFDDDTVVRVAETMLRDDLITGVTIRNERGQSIVSVREKNINVELVQSQPIYFRDQTVGELELVFSRSHLNDALANILWVSLLIWLLTVLSVTVLTHILVRTFFQEPFRSFTDLAKVYREYSEPPQLPATSILEFQPIEEVVKNLANSVFTQLKELQKSEIYYRSLFENMLYGIAIEGPDSTYTKVNDAWCKLIGYTQEELVGQLGIKDVTVPGALPESVELIEKLASGKVKESRLEKQYQTKSGNIIDTITFIKGMYDEQGLYLGNAASILDITERTRAAEHLQDAYVRLRELSRQLERAKEAERKRIARELHDEFGQSLSSLKWDLACLRRELPSQEKWRDRGKAEARIHSMSTLLTQTIQTTRRIAISLRPPLLDDLGLVPALEWQALDFQNRTGIRCGLSIDPSIVHDSITAEQTTALFRVTQELLTNILRHAQASQVNIRLREKDRLFLLEVDDNGIGFSKPASSPRASLGLLGIQERSVALGGDFTIGRVPGGGTLAVVQIPVEVGAISLKGQEEDYDQHPCG